MKPTKPVKHSMDAAWIVSEMAATRRDATGYAQRACPGFYQGRLCGLRVCLALIANRGAEDAPE